MTRLPGRPGPSVAEARAIAEARQSRDLSECIRAYQAAEEYAGQCQAQKAAASGAYFEASQLEQAALRALETAKEEMLAAAREIKFPPR